MRIADELSRPVVGGLASTVGLHDLDLGALRDVELALVRPAPEGDDGRVLEQDHGVRDLVLDHSGGQRALELPGLEVRHAGPAR